MSSKYLLCAFILTTWEAESTVEEAAKTLKSKIGKTCILEQNFFLNFDLN